MEIFSFPWGCDTAEITYSYHKRGSSEEYLPDKILEDYRREEYSYENGKLFCGKEVAWSGPLLLSGGIDIKICLGSSAFADHANLIFAAGTKLENIEIFSDSDGELIKIGCFKPQSGSHDVPEEVKIDVGTQCQKIVIRLNGAYSDIVLKKLEVKACRGISEEPYPLCSKIEYKEESFSLNGSAICAVGEDELFAAKHLQQRLKEKCCGKIEVSNSGSIVIEKADCDEEEYFIDVNKDGIFIKGGSRKALLYAVETLVYICDGINVKACTICDKPAFEFRGIHIALPSRSCFDFLKKLIKNVLVPMRYNTVFLQISAAMRYDKFPEINDAWTEACQNHADGKWPIPGHYYFVGHDILEKSEVAELCSYMRDYGMEIIPEVQCLSHSQYITCAYPDMAEITEETEGETDLYVADERIDSFYYHSLCPSHERYYEVVCGIIDEVIEATKPERYVSIGHDELYEAGICPKCRQKGAAEMFVEEVTALNNYIKSKGLKTMMWSDMLHEKQYKVLYCINKIPKDITMLDFTWYFHLDEDIEEDLLSRGFKVIIGNLYSSHFPRYEKRSKADGIIGGEVSTWVYCSEESYAYEGKMYDLVYTANMLWHGGHRDDTRLSYNEFIKPIVFDIRKKIGGFKTDGAATKISVGGSSRAIPLSIRDSVPYESAARVSRKNTEISFDASCFGDIVCVTHATDRSAERIMWEKPTNLGKYTVVYEDGSTCESPILYGCNIGRYDMTYGKPISSPLFRHEGYTATYMAKPVCGKAYDGSDYTIYKHYITNVERSKKISKIILCHSGDSDAEIILFDIEIIKQEEQQNEKE